MKTSHLLLLFGLTTTLATQAASLLVNAPPGWNGIFMELEVRSGFRQAGLPMGAETHSTDTQNVALYPNTYTGGETISGYAYSTFAPDAGAMKDEATGALTFTYLVGAGGAADQFSIGIDSTTSATTAQMDFGAGLENADAFVEMDLYFRTYGPLSGAVLTLPGLPTLTGIAPTSESMLALISGPAVGYMLPGSEAIDYPLDLAPSGDFFEYHLNYSVVTPFGSDPQIIYNITGGVVSNVPEPSSLLLLGLSTLACLRRKRN